MKPFIRYVISRYQETQREMAYRIYVSDSLFYYPQQKALSVRYCDLVNPKSRVNKAVDANQIIDDIIARAGLVVK